MHLPSIPNVNNLHMIALALSGAAVALIHALQQLWKLIATIITFFDKRAEKKAEKARAAAKRVEDSAGKKLAKKLKPAIGGEMPSYEELQKIVAELGKRVDSLDSVMQPVPVPLSCESRASFATTTKRPTKMHAHTLAS